MRGLEDYGGKPISNILVGTEETAVSWKVTDETAVRTQRDTVMNLLHKASEGAQPCILNTYTVEQSVDAQTSFFANAKFGQNSYETIIRKGRQRHGSEIRLSMGTCEGVNQAQQQRLEHMKKRSGLFSNGWQDFEAVCPKCMKNLGRFLDRVHQRCVDSQSSVLELTPIFTGEIVHDQHARNPKKKSRHHQLEVEGHELGHSRASADNIVMDE